MLKIFPSASLVISHSNSLMKKIFLVLSFITLLAHAAPTPLETTIADTLANYDIIVDSSKNPNGYRLTDTITRAEAVGVALKVADV